MKLKYTYLLLITGLIGILLFAAFSADEIEEQEKRNDKLIKFSHSFHAELAECADCHSKAVESVSLKDRLMPDHDNCGSCHEVDNEDNCNTCHYEDRYEALVQKESELIFSHAFHIQEQKMECESCHKGLKEVDYSFQAVQPLPQMIDCYSCHNDRSIAANTCEACHTSTAGLLPQDHRTASFETAHKFAAQNFDANCFLCHDSNTNSCEECHAANHIITEGNMPDDFYQPYAPNNFVDGARKQKINRVHELNYRFIHGIDARGKTKDCQTCHQTETFCASCHQSENSDFSMGGIMPASHLKPGFFTIGAGSGGGDHAIFARRDIESCAACHDANGADPACMNCHLDSDGIKGTNPKTHQRNFMRDIRGDWHDSQGSVCYNCHTSSMPSSLAGNGFCGYCHGSK